ncbi:hypothetical protein BC351_37290 [Paenibacillus ferrarius]|uniref:Uncharacterized protein n=1 Tax=Paenibacillus ferrarius TaxID=1469647 RepID=A0A1V4HB36_9BACL|nr:hypothetical protein BC351_37290 [Paenibacillus ferrarius]
MEGEIINYSDFQLYAIRWKDFLTPKDKPLDQLVKMDHERIYTSALFFSLTSQELFQVVIDLSKRDKAVKNKLVDLYHALTSKDLPENVSPLAQNIKNLFFLPIVMDLLKNLSPSKTSKYMEKYISNLVFEYKLEHKDDN